MLSRARANYMWIHLTGYFDEEREFLRFGKLVTVRVPVDWCLFIPSHQLTQGLALLLMKFWDSPPKDAFIIRALDIYTIMIGQGPYEYWFEQIDMVFMFGERPMEHLFDIQVEYQRQANGNAPIEIDLMREEEEEEEEEVIIIGEVNADDHGIDDLQMEIGANVEIELEIDGMNPPNNVPNGNNDDDANENLRGWSDDDSEPGHLFNEDWDTHSEDSRMTPLNTAADYGLRHDHNYAGRSGDDLQVTVTATTTMHTIEHVDGPWFTVDITNDITITMETEEMNENGNGEAEE